MGFNDAPMGTALAGTAAGMQFRLVTGDFDFDGDVDCDDRAMIELASAESWTLDDTSDDFVRDFNTDNKSDDVTYTGYARQAEVFNATLAMMRMDLSDGSTGEWDSGQVIENGLVVAWGGAVTADDLAAFDALLGGPDANMDGVPDECQASARFCADVNDDGMITPADFTAWLAIFSSLGTATPDQIERADVNDDGMVTPADFTAWLNFFSQGMNGPACP